MKKNDFKQLFESVLNMAAILTEQKIGQHISRNFLIHLYAPKYSGTLMTLDEAVDEIYLGEEKFYLIIDVGITELRGQETIAITKVSGHKPGSFDQTWNDPPGNGPFKVIIPAKILVKENISGASPESSLRGVQPNKERNVNSLVAQPEDTLTLSTYKKFLDNYWQLSQRVTLLDARIQQKYKTIQEKLRSLEREQVRALNEQLHQLHQSYWNRLPNYIVARCPYCETQILQPVDHFSLMGFYPLINIPDFYHGAYHISKTWAYPEPPRQSCRHALLATISVNLNHRKPNDLPQWSFGRKWLYMDSSPRVMVWPLLARRTSAVIHTLPIGRLDDPEPVHHYTAYFITYFMDDTSNLTTKEMWVPTDLGTPATDGVTYDPDLLKWVEAGRLYWLDPNDPSRLMKGPVGEFPYFDIKPQGRYRIIENGEVEGPHPYSPRFTWQGKAPSHSESFPKTIE